MSSFFKNIAVTYYTAQIYNSTLEDMKAEIDEQFSSPLLDAASNYVCAVERMELSGNNIFFYSVDQDEDGRVYDKSIQRYSTQIHFLSSDLKSSYYDLYLYGGYASLGSLIDALNNWKNRQDDSGNTGDWFVFTLTGDGKIRITIDTLQTDSRWGKDLIISFDSDRLASIFGLPAQPTGNCSDWFIKYSELTWFDNLAFQTKSSRVDCGIIPTLLQLRSTLPFESDQVSNAKANIVTDFNIVPGSGADFSPYDAQRFNEKTAELEDMLTVIDKEKTEFQVEAFKYSAISQGVGGMLIYTPNERRWLNFSAPIPIYYIRMWVEIIKNDPDEQDSFTQYKIPPGGKFSIKLGFYLRDT